MDIIISDHNMKISSSIYEMAKRHPFALFAIFSLLFAFVSSLAEGRANIDDKSAVIFLVAALSLVIMAGLVLIISRRMTTGSLVFLIFVFGIIMRLVYILYTAVEQRQQDVYSFGRPEGHAGYIEYIYNNLKLPDFDPRDRWQFYHPPLHHMISAIWLKLIVFAGATWEKAKESLQVLTFFYSGCYLIFTYKIFKEVGLKNRALMLSFFIIAVNPAFVLISGSVNNDALSILLMQGTVYYAVLWFKDMKMSTIVKLALCIGFGMMAKLSIVLVAPAILLLFLIKIFLSQDTFSKTISLSKFNDLNAEAGNENLPESGLQKLNVGSGSGTGTASNSGSGSHSGSGTGSHSGSGSNSVAVKNTVKGLLGQFVIFGFISLPLGLWWGIRNAVLFKLPFTYVPSLGDNSHQYIGHYSVFERLFDFSLYQFKSVYVAWGEPYFEHNIFIGLLKTSVFGEQVLSGTDTLFYNFAVVAFYINLIVVLLAVFCMICILFKKVSLQALPLKMFFTVIYITFMLSYIRFCFAYPHTCTQNIRYVTPAIWIGAMAIGFVLQKIIDYNKRSRSDA